MKKSFVAASALAALCALPLTTSAAANPFTDVPTDHWAYDAVSQLASDGVIEGYGDTSFRGDRAITRYEMAQMVARAMANKEKASQPDQLLIDKLSAEYAAELENLGVRVANLERNADRVKFSGYIYAREQTQHIKDKRHDTASTTSVNRMFLDLIATANVNKNWDVVYETNTMSDMNKDKVDDTYDFYEVSAFARGKYGNTTYKLGRMDTYSADGGVIMHNPISGGAVTFGNKLKTTLTAARICNINLASLGKSDVSGDYQSIELAYPTSKATKVFANAYHLHDSKYQALRGSEDPYIWEVGFQNQLGKDWRLTGYYLHATNNTPKYRLKDGYYAQIDYRKYLLKKPGTWQIYAKYAYTPELVQLGMDVGHFRDYKGV